MAGHEKVTEMRGCRGLVFAELKSDTREAIEWGTVQVLAPVQSIERSCEVSRAKKFYDNTAAMVATSEGEDAVNFVIATPTPQVAAAVNGRVYDDELKMYIECPIVTRWYAVGYIMGETDGTETYVWKYKGYFDEPTEATKTEDDGTDGTNFTLGYHAVHTVHQFANGGGKGKPATGKGFKMRTDSGKNLTKFFEEVHSVDSVFDDLPAADQPEAEG